MRDRKSFGQLAEGWIWCLKPMKAKDAVMMFRAISTHTAGRERVKQIIGGISYTALYRLVFIQQ